MLHRLVDRGRLFGSGTSAGCKDISLIDEGQMSVASDVFYDINILATKGQKKPLRRRSRGPLGLENAFTFAGSLISGAHNVGATSPLNTDPNGSLITA